MLRTSFISTLKFVGFWDWNVRLILHCVLVHSWCWYWFRVGAVVPLTMFFFTGLSVGQLKKEEEKLKTEIFKEDKKDLGKIPSFGAVGILLHVSLLLAKNIYYKQITIEKAQSAKGDSARNRQMVLRADSRKGRGSHSQSFVVLYLYFFNQPFQGSFSFSVFKQLLFPLSNTIIP